jgi:hypothetical protein
MGGCWEQISCREATHLPSRAGHHLDAHGQSGQSHTERCGSIIFPEAGALVKMQQYFPVFSIS